MSNIKEAINELKNNEEFIKRLDEVNKNSKNRDEAKSLTLQLINEYGYDFNESDLTDVTPLKNGALSDDELEAVSGGGNINCYCAIGGGSSGGTWECACIIGGGGSDGHGNVCICPIGGSGNNME